ncbi:MAG: nitroreductase [Dokdonella sp.]|uniref:nitroreductase family protein n=1 Tax=Dokdonella sp. TaxID=2291710 RepID=UPI0025C026EA|nr:nitroreductase [Dokdonella sp.]MBZ0223639.1 nitroreductase [Dokdonella sp.]
MLGFFAAGITVDLLDLLNARRSTPSRLLGEPGPTPTELQRLLQSAVRVPDHGRLDPFRLIALDGAARARFGEALARIHARVDPATPDAALDKDRKRYLDAPLILVVVARIDEHHAKVPAQEQLLSAGCVGYNLLLGAQALGYGAQMLTGWAAYDRDVAALLGLAENERVVMFVHIGTPREEAPERARPAVADLLSHWQ